MLLFNAIKYRIINWKDFLKRRLGPFYMFVLSHILPLKNKKIVFNNFAGRGYGDNPKYVANEILSRNLGYDLVWIVRKGSSFVFPKGIRTVELGSWREMYELATAKCWIDNNRKANYIYKNKRQCYIQLWHGFYPFKKIEKDAENELDKGYVVMAKHDGRMTDLMVSGCKSRTDLYRKSFWYSGEIKEWGTPRNDLFFNGNNYKSLVYEYFGISSKVKTLLYAPTFRDDYSVDAYNIDFNRLLESLCGRFGGEWCIFVRLHPAVREKSGFLHYTDTIIDASAYDDIQELFAATDILITDYSNCMSEFSLQLKPVILYASDLEAYSKGRSFYYDIHDLPYPIAENNDDLNSIIANFDISLYRKELEAFLKDIGSFEKGTASKEVVDYILSL